MLVQKKTPQVMLLHKLLVLHRPSATVFDNICLLQDFHHNMKIALEEGKIGCILPGMLECNRHKMT